MQLAVRSATSSSGFAKVLGREQASSRTGGGGFDTLCCTLLMCVLQPVDCAKDKPGVTALVPRQSPPRMSPAVKPESKAEIDALMQKCMTDIAPEDEAKRINQIDEFYALCTVQYSVNTSLSPTPPAATTSNSSTFSFSSYGQPGVRFLPSTISQLIKVLTEQVGCCSACSITCFIAMVVQLRIAYLDQYRMSKLAARSLQLLGEVLRSRKCTKVFDVCNDV